MRRNGADFRGPRAGVGEAPKPVAQFSNSGEPAAIWRTLLGDTHVHLTNQSRTPHP